MCGLAGGWRLGGWHRRHRLPTACPAVAALPSRPRTPAPPTRPPTYHPPAGPTGLPPPPRVSATSTQGRMMAASSSTVRGCWLLLPGQRWQGAEQGCSQGDLLLLCRVWVWVWVPLQGRQSEQAAAPGAPPPVLPIHSLPPQTPSRRSRWPSWVATIGSACGTCLGTPRCHCWPQVGGGRSSGLAQAGQGCASPLPHRPLAPAPPHPTLLQCRSTARPSFGSQRCLERPRRRRRRQRR